MPVDVRISQVETQLTARDPNLVNDPKFIAMIVARVVDELKRHELEDGRRAADTRTSRVHED